MRDEDDAIFIEQEEVRAIRTREWLYMNRFDGNKDHPFENELYDLVSDPGEKHNLSGNVNFTEVEQVLRSRLDDYFAEYSNAAYDLWHGGSLKSNSDKPWFWKEAWGEDWEPVFG